jgi:hypothetical protein
LTITATGGGGGGSTGDLSFIGSTISSGSNGDLNLITSGTGRVIMGSDEINTTTWPDTYSNAGNSTSTRHKGPLMFHSDLAMPAVTSADNSRIITQRVGMVTLDTGSTQVNSNNHRVRIQDLLYYDIKGTEHGTSITQTSQGPLAGDHQLYFYNTSGGTLNGGNATVIQGYGEIRPGHGGDLTLNRVTAVLGNLSIQGNTGSEVTRVTDAAAFRAIVGTGGNGNNGTNRIITNRYGYYQEDQSGSALLATNDYSFVTDTHAARAKPGAIERFREYGLVATHSASGTYTVNAANNLHIVTLGANITSFTMSNFPAVTAQSAAVTLLLVQDNTGGRSVTFSAGSGETFKFANGTNASTITAANDIQVVYVFSRYNGTSTTYYWTMGPAFS